MLNKIKCDFRAVTKMTSSSETKTTVAATSSQLIAGAHIHRSRCPGNKLAAGTELDVAVAAWQKIMPTMSAIQVYATTSGQRKQVLGKTNLRKQFGGVITVHEPHINGVFKKNFDVANAVAQVEAVGADFYVAHIVGTMTIAEHIENVKIFRASLAKVGHDKTTVIMEMPRRVPSKTSYETPEKLNVFIADVIKAGLKPSEAAFCIDTSHIFPNTTYDISLYDDAKKYLKAIANPEYIRLFHLNGSAHERKSGKDTHALPFSKTDKIWYGKKYSESGFAAFVEFAIANKIPVIFEMNEDDDIDSLPKLFNVLVK